VRSRVPLLWSLVALLVSAPLVWIALHSEQADADLDRGALAISPCGLRGTPTSSGYRHVIWIWMENHSYEQIINSGEAPFENELAQVCGLATDYHAVTHPSLPNYLAATSGSTYGIHTDPGPGLPAPAAAPSLFGEIRSSGQQWRTFAESMPGNCRPIGGHGYARNPAVYYRDARTMCSRWDVPMGTPTSGPLASALRHDRLPALSVIIPSLCHSTHARRCDVDVGDAWLSRLLTTMVHSRAYRGGDTAIFLTWDEGSRSHTQHIPLIVVSPTTARGTVVPARYDHYSLLRTTAVLLHVRPLGKAASAPSMRSAFGL
jgi:phospholipase C